MIYFIYIADTRYKQERKYLNQNNQLNEIKQLEASQVTVVHKSQAEYHKEIGLKGALCTFQTQSFDIYNIKR